MFKSHLVAAGAFLLTSSLLAQQTTPPATGTPVAGPRPTAIPLQVPTPHYVFIPMTIEVHAPVDKVWARVGKFCDIGEWSGNSGVNTCKITSGSDGEFGAVRTVANEVLVGKTRYSYTYAAPPRTGVTYDLYHGTLEAVPLSATTTRLNYTLVFDNSMQADDTARDTDLANRRTRFTRSLGNMKILAEGGTLPPAPPRPAVAPGGAGAPGGPGRGTFPPMNPNPHYVSIPMTIEVNAPVDTVWARVGKYCDIGEWGFPGCTITSGSDGEFGAVRSIGTEVLVGKTKYSYTYGQPLRATGAYILYHGTLEAVALTPLTTQINYTLLYDNSNLADDAARETDLSNRRTRFTGMLTNMKTLSEGGTLPPGAVGGSRGRGIVPTRPQ